MAKKNKSNSSETITNYQVVKATAFWGIIIAGIAGLIGFVFRILTIPDWEWLKKAFSPLNTVANVMNLVSSIALFISVFLAGWAHSKSKNKTWRILFWVFAILALLGLLGVNILGMFIF